eukprot:scaffold302_cov247-Pinguiococcus_pyrenoidosus.AAC.5
MKRKAAPSDAESGPAPKQKKLSPNLQQMKFMQRKAAAEADESAVAAKETKSDGAFLGESEGTRFLRSAKRLSGPTTLGRRSFGGFNSAIEAANAEFTRQSTRPSGRVRAKLKAGTKAKAKAKGRMSARGKGRKRKHQEHEDADGW